MSERRQFLVRAGGLGLSAIASAPRARTPDFNFVAANILSATHPLNVRLNEAASAIREESRDRVSIQVFPGGQLGSDPDMLAQLRRGEIHFMTLSGPILSTLVPVAAVNGIGFAFKDYDRVWRAMDGPLGAHVRAEIGAAGLVAFEHIWDNGFRQITTTERRIATPADLKGLRLRVPVGPLWTSMFKAFAADPMSLNFGEVYTALQARVVEGQENPLAVVQMARLHEVQRHCAMTHHMWDGFWFLANGKVWSGLPAEVRQLVKARVSNAALRQRADVRQLNARLEAQLTRAGMVFNRPEMGAFREALSRAGFYADWRQRLGAETWDLLERTTGPLA
jgi:TRAP-type transport system periplasmic protein